MTALRSRGWRESRRQRRLAETVEDNRPHPLIWVLRVGCVVAVAVGALFWMLKGGR